MSATAVLRRPHWETLEDLTFEAVFVVEVSSFEKQALWERYAREVAHLDRRSGPRVHWQDQGRGWWFQIAEVDKRPVMISVFGALLNDSAILFYEATSEVVDWKAIEEWFREHCWPMWDSDTRRAHCDAMNFHHCLEVVRGTR